MHTMSQVRAHIKIMNKDFNNWNTKKTHIHHEKMRPFFHEREIWFCSLGVNVGFEQDGGKGFLRPVVVIKKFNNDIAWCVPLTTKEKHGKYYVEVIIDEVKGNAILSQLRLIDGKRFHYKVGDIDEAVFDEIKRKIRQLLV